MITIKVEITPAIQDRMRVQCERLGLTRTAIAKMAFVKFFEEEEREMAPGYFENKPLYVRLSPELKQRLKDQCDRLGVTQSDLTKIALAKYLEEEESTGIRAPMRVPKPKLKRRK